MFSVLIPFDHHENFQEGVEALDRATGVLEAWIYPVSSPLKSGLQKPVSLAKIL